MSPAARQPTEQAACYGEQGQQHNDAEEEAYQPPTGGGEGAGHGEPYMSYVQVDQ